MFALIMLSIFLQLFCCAHQKASSDESQNICQQLCSFVNSRLDCEEYFLLRKSSKSLYTCVEIRDEFFSCFYWNFEMQEIEGHMFEVVCTGDMLATEIGALMLATKIRTFMHGFFKSFNVDNVFVYATRNGLNHLCKKGVQEKLINALRTLSCGESGPKYYFKGYVSDELSLIARTRNKNNEWEKQLEDFCIGGNLDIRLDVDKDFYFVFDIDLSYFNYKLMLKYYANAIFGYLDGMGGEIFCKFLSNFDFVYSYNIKVLVGEMVLDRRDLLNLKKLSCEERKEKLLLKEGSCSTKLSFECAYACLEWIDKISEQDSRYEKYIEEIEESEGLEKILVFMFLISRQEIFKLLLAHVLSSEPNFKKSLLAEVLFQLNAIDEDTMENLLQRKNLLNLQSWKEKIDDEFLAPLLRLTNMLPFHSTLIRYLFVILFAEMNSLEKDCKEVKDFLSTCHSDYEKLSVGFLKSLELLQPDHPLVKNFSVTSSGKFSLLHKIILLTSSDYELSFTNYVYQRLSVQCKEIMNFYVNPTRRIKRKEKEQIAALYEKMKLIVAKSLDETS